MEAFPPFEIAVDRFKGFLRREGLRDEIRWIWRENVLTRRAPGSVRSWRRRIYVDLRNTSDASLVQRYYQWGVNRNLGIALCVFCVTSSCSCSYVYVPEGEEDASQRMMGSLKLQVPALPPTATAVTNASLVRLLRVCVGTPGNAWINELPRRSDAEQV